MYRSVLLCFFFFQAEDGIRDLVRSRGLGDVYKRQIKCSPLVAVQWMSKNALRSSKLSGKASTFLKVNSCLLYTSDAADERSSVDLGGRRIIKKKTHRSAHEPRSNNDN